MKISQIRKSITDFFLQSLITEEQLKNFKLTISDLVSSPVDRKVLLKIIQDKAIHFNNISGLKLKAKVTVEPKENNSDFTHSEAKRNWKVEIAPKKQAATASNKVPEDLLGMDINCWGVYLPTRVHLLSKALGVKPKALIRMFDNDSINRRTSIITADDVEPHIDIIKKLATDRTKGIYETIDYRGFRIEREELKKERSQKMNYARFISVGMKS